MSKIRPKIWNTISVGAENEKGIPVFTINLSLTDWKKVASDLIEAYNKLVSEREANNDNT